MRNYLTGRVKNLTDNFTSNDKTASLVFAVLASVCFALVLLYLSGIASKWTAIFALSLFFPMFAAKIRSIRKAFAALLIFSFSVHMDFNPWYSDMNIGIPISLTGLAVVALYVIWFFNLLNKTARPRLFPSVTIPLGALCIWSGLSFLVSLNPSYVWYYFVFSLEFFLIYFYAANFLRTEEDIRFIVNCVAFTVLFSAGVGICQYLFPNSFNFQFMGWENEALKLYYKGIAITRAVGFLGHSNALALFLNAWLPLLILYASGIERSATRLLCFLSFGAGIIALVLTFSRGGWLTFALSSFLILGFFLRGRISSRLSRFIRFIPGIALVLLLLVIPFSPYIHDRLSRDDYEAAESRIKLAKTAFEIIKEKPVTGVGLGNYRLAVPSEPYSDELPPPVHNIYLKIAAELGIPAAVLFIWICLTFLRWGLASLSSGERYVLCFSIGLIGGLVAICFHGMFEPGSIGDPVLLPLSFIGGLMVSLRAFVRNKR
ncbi:MAG: O-antigen ligase family protein [Candidatus Omnitrophica bacterium]|nr:O-antigen ligase family protein [Candidatus Omnitrophota bacterium]